MSTASETPWAIGGIKWDKKRGHRDNVVIHNPILTCLEDISMRRIVQIFIADIDENVPMEKSLLYEGKPKFTDLTDQELYFELNIKHILDTHNEYRTTLLDKKASKTIGKDVYLEPIKIRDLKMVVVEIARF